MKEQDFGHGARNINPLRRKVNRLLRQKMGKSSIPFDWSKPFDVRDTIGPITIKNQGQNDSCGGQAGSYFLEVQRRLQGIKEGDISAKSIYGPIAYPGGGTTVTALETQIGAHGANLESTVPSYDAYGNPLSESMMVEKSWMTPETIKDAMTRAGYTPIDVSRDIDSVAAAIRDYGGVIWEISGQNNGTWISANPKPPTSKQSLWNHFMAGIGAKLVNGQKTLIVLNSWGTSAGDSGVYYFTQDYFDAKGIIDVFTFDFDANLEPVESPAPTIWQALNLWFRNKFGLSIQESFA